MSHTAVQESIYSRITNRIIVALEQGGVLWKGPLASPPIIMFGQTKTAKRLGYGFHGFEQIFRIAPLPHGSSRNEREEPCYGTPIEHRLKPPDVVHQVFLFACARSDERLWSDQSNPCNP